MHVLAKISLGPLIDHSKSIEGSPSSKLGTKNITPSKYFFFAIPYCYEPIRPLRRYQGTYVNISRFSFSIKRPSYTKSSFFRVLPWQYLKVITEEDYELWKKYLLLLRFWKLSLELLHLKIARAKNEPFFEPLLHLFGYPKDKNGTCSLMKQA